TLLAWLALRRGVPPSAGLTKEDQGEILKLVRRELWKRPFHPFSWRTLPGSLWDVATSHIQGVKVLEDTAVLLAKVGSPLSSGKSGDADKTVQVQILTVS